MSAPLWLDIETRSRCDLRTRGVYNYADERSTEVLIVSYALGDGPVKRWTVGKPLHPTLINALNDKRVQIRAHNAAFERLLLSRWLARTLPIDRFYCTSAQAKAVGLPSALEDAPRALGITQRKDRRGHELIRLLSVPREDGTFLEDAKLFAEFGDYCDQDVVTMRALSQSLPALDDEALATYHANERVNDRGLPIDTELCEAALRYAEVEGKEAVARIIELTGGTLKKARGTKLTQWVHERLAYEVRNVMEVYKDGKKKLTLDADTRNNLLVIAEEEPDRFDPVVVDVIEAADAAAASSVAKFGTMLARVSSDGRLRGAFVFNGAMGTGRFSSTGAQVHNFPRTVAKDVEGTRKLMLAGKKPLGSVMQMLKSMLRPAIRAGEGKVILRADWNAVEARGLPWLANTPQATRYLAQFDGPGDVYVTQAVAAGLGEHRQAGKVVVLALGYGGAEGALTVMAKGYGVQIEEKGRVVRRWREANRWAPRFWYDSRDAAMLALRGHARAAGRIVYERHDGLAITARLPSGRRLYYPLAEDEGDGITYVKGSWKPKADAKGWPRARIWHGILVENATQGACADLLRHVIRERDDRLIGHVHDETIEEVSARQAKRCAADLARAMMDAPAWASDFPLKVETDYAPTFRK